MTDEIAEQLSDAAADQRQRVLQALVVAATEKGYAATTLVDIALQAGLPEQAVLAHFPDKDDVYLRMHQDVVTSVLTVIKDARAESIDLPSWRDRVRQVVRRYLECMAAGRHHLAEMLISATAESNAVRRAQVATGARFGAEMIALSEELAAQSNEVEILTPARALVFISGTTQLLLMAAPAGRDAVLAQEDAITDALVRMLRAL
jgi:AcrR family transcriptional regulator